MGCLCKRYRRGYYYYYNSLIVFYFILFYSILFYCIVFPTTQMVEDTTEERINWKKTKEKKRRKKAELWIRRDTEEREMKEKRIMCMPIEEERVKETAHRWKKMGKKTNKK